MRFSLLLFVILVQIPIGASCNKLDSLLNTLTHYQEKGSSKELIKTHLSLGETLSSKSEEKYEQSIPHYDLALRLAINERDYKAAATALFSSGVSYKRTNNYPKALEKFYQFIELEEGTIEPIRKAQAYTHISSIYQALGDYEKAFEQQMQALLIFEVEKDATGIANSHYNIGTIFFYQLQYQKALESYQKAKEICDVLDKKHTIYSCLAALGTVYAKLDRHEESLDYNRRALDLAERLNYKTGIAYAKGNVGTNLVTQKKYTEAEEFYKEAIQLKTELGDTYSVIGSKVELAQLYLNLKKAEKAKKYLKDALVSAKKLDSRGRQSDIYKNLALAYDQLNQPLIAYKYNKKYVSLKDSLLNEKTLEEMGQSKRRFEVQKSDYEIQMLRKGNELLAKNEKIRKQQIYLFAITIFAFLTFILWNLNKLNYQNKVNKLLEEKNQLLNATQDEIQIKNKQLELSNEDLKQFAHVASHDLKEPLRMINSYTQLLKRRYSSSFDESGNEFMHYIIDAVGRMETLLNDILAFSKAGSQSLPTTFVDTNEVLLVVESNLRHRLKTLEANLIIKNNNMPLIKAHRTQLIQLLQNLVSNAIKFKGDRDPIVEVNAEPVENGYIFSVKDNGIGISKENCEKIFEMFHRLHTRQEYEGTGIGLATCKRITTTWNGDLWVESKEGQGSTFFFSVPYVAVQPTAVSSEKVESVLVT